MLNKRNIILGISALLLFLGGFFLFNDRDFPFGAPIAIDNSINILTETQSQFEVSFIQTLPESGEAKVIIMKGRSEIRLQKWDGEVDLGISYPKIQAQGRRAFATNRMEWKGAKEEIHAYPLEPAEDMEDGGFEIEIVLNEKPITNVFEFEIDGYENLDFWYQPTLTQEEIDKGFFRPENIVGSYAVYHKTKRDHRVGSTNYAVGKAFHIYRPKAIDANGNEVWAVLSYLDAILSVTVPQSFLDTAIYPVIVDPTFGLTTQGGSNFNIESTVWGSWAVLTEVGTVTMLSQYLEATTEDKLSEGAIYEYVARGDADSPLHFTDEITITSTAGFFDFPMTTPPELTADTYYLFVNCESLTGNCNAFYDSGGGGSGFDVNTSGENYGTWPDPLTDNNNANLRASIYATYTVAGGAAPSDILPEVQIY